MIGWIIESLHKVQLSTVCSIDQNDIERSDQYSLINSELQKVRQRPGCGDRIWTGLSFEKQSSNVTNEVTRRLS